MILIGYILLAQAAWGLIVFVYVLSQGVVGTWVGASVEEVSVGCGRRLWWYKTGGVTWSLRLLPYCGFTKFFGDTDEDELENPTSIESPNPEGDERRKFKSLPLSAQLCIFIIGPVSNLVLGAVLLSIPVLLQTPQLAVDATADRPILPSAVPNLGVQNQGSTCTGQMKLFCVTFLEFFRRLFTLESVSGWGGPVSAICTTGSAGRTSLPSMLTCLGILCLGNGIVNLLPFPPFNGGHFCVVLWKMMFGRVGETSIERLTILSMVAVVALNFYLYYLDFLWISVAMSNRGQR